MSTASLSGYPTSLFVSEPSDALKCPLCLEVLKDPRQCPKGHCFCSTCISTSLSSSKRCPVCRCKLHADSLSVNLLAHNTVLDLKVFCNPTSYRGEGGDTSDRCSWIGPLSQLQSHATNECMYTEVKCSYKGCHSEVQRRLLPAHQERCPHRVMSCIYCSYSFKLKHMTCHMTNCQKRPVYCSNQCGVMCSFEDQESHLAECPFALIPCPLIELCGSCSKCSGTIRRQDARQHVCSPEVIESAVYGLVLRSKETQEELECRNNYLLLDNALLRMSQHVMQSCLHSRPLPRIYSSASFHDTHTAAASAAVTAVEMTQSLREASLGTCNCLLDLVKVLHPLRDRTLVLSLSQQVRHHLHPGEVEQGVDIVSTAALFEAPEVSQPQMKFNKIRGTHVTLRGEALVLSIGLKRRSVNGMLLSYLNCKGSSRGYTYRMTTVQMRSKAWHCVEGCCDEGNEHIVAHNVSHLIDNQSYASTRHRVRGEGDQVPPPQLSDSSSSSSSSSSSMLVFVTVFLAREDASESSEGESQSMDEVVEDYEEEEEWEE